jgi:hypothetical protein
MATISAIASAKEGGSRLKKNFKKQETLSEKQTKSRKTVDMVLVIEHLPCKHEALNSVSRTEKTLYGRPLSVKNSLALLMG